MKISAHTDNAFKSYDTSELASQVTNGQNNGFRQLGYIFEPQ